LEKKLLALSCLDIESALWMAASPDDRRPCLKVSQAGDGLDYM